MPVIMGTAGHIDHGKTSLVRALTGIDCDRLEEEKRRGITIELGFAFLDLPGVERIGVVDVPGHERFVKNMVAGAAGIDFVMLVVAADEGVMPQTREHLEICTLLGVDKGLVALTKVDAVEPDLMEMAVEDVRNYLADSFLSEAPIIPVSSVTGQGLDDLRRELADIVSAFRPRRRSDLFRLPIDRVFTMKGHGTVVTGTLISGSVKVGDDVLVYPGEKPTKIRNLQVHGKMVGEAFAGQRTAVNLSSLELEDLNRGDEIAHPGSLFPSYVWDVELYCLPSARKGIRHRSQVHFHHGSREVAAGVYLHGQEKLGPGERVICQVRFKEPMVGVYGDRCVLRSHSPLRTIAGGRIINPLGAKIRKASGDLEKLKSMGAKGDEEFEDFLLTRLALAGDKGLSFGRLRIVTDRESKFLEKILLELGGRQKLFIFDRENRTYVSGEIADSLHRDMLGYIGEFHRKEPMKQGILKGELSSVWGKDLSPRLFHFLLERAVKKGEVVSEQEVLRLPGHKASMAKDEERVGKGVLAAYNQGGLTPPNLKDVLEALKTTPREAAPVLKLLQERSELIKVKEDMYFSARAVNDLKERIIAFFKNNEEMGPVEFKELANVSRKYAIPLLEFFDKEKITVRVGDKRRLRKG